MATGSDEKRGLDVFGIEPVSRAIEKATEATLRAAGEFLKRICLPAAQEFGYLLEDQVRAWRVRNMARIAQKAEAQLAARQATNELKAPPRIASAVLDHGSWSDNDDLQSMWAGLLASACTEEADDETNLMFVNLLSQLTHTQAKLVDYAVATCGKRSDPHGLVLAEAFYMTLEDLKRVTGVDDLHRLDRELDHLRGIDLIGAPLGGGFLFEHVDVADVTPTSIAIHLYVRCHGSRAAPGDYFKVHTGAS